MMPATQACLSQALVVPVAATVLMATPYVVRRPERRLTIAVLAAHEFELHDTAGPSPVCGT
jgi:hypothetical protein